MRKRFLLATVIAVLLASASISAQTFSAPIQQFWNQLRTGSIAIATGRIQASGYLNFGATVGTNGYGIRDNAGTLQFKNSGGAWAGIVAAITGGTCTNQAVTAVAASTGVPTCTTLTSAYVDSSIAQAAAANLFTATQTITKLTLGTTSTDGVVAQNTTAATGGATVQISPRLRFHGTAWDTSASQTVDMIIEALPVSAGTPSAILKFGYSLNGAAFSYPVSWTSAGVVTAADYTASSSGFNIGSGGVFRSAAFGTKITMPTSDGLINLQNNANTAGIGFDITTDSTLKVRTRAQSGYGTLDALGLIFSGAALTQHGLVVAGSAGAMTNVAVCGTGTYVRGAAAADPICSTLVLPNTATAGQYLIATTSNTVIGVQPALNKAQPADQTARSSSGAFVMMGLGAAVAPCTITPAATGRVVFTISGDIVNNTNATTVTIQMAEGTGTAPANNASATGTVISGAPVLDGLTSALTVPFSITSSVTGLALSTAVWFDLQLKTSTTNTGGPTNITCVANEI